ncbi:MAG: metallophosphoesterase [Pseudomonadota bacterium]
MHIIAFGDIHEQTSNLKRIKSISSADCLIVTGDLTNMGERDRAEAVMREVEDLNRCIYAQAGNFDRRSVDQYLAELGINLHGNGFLLKTHIGVFGVGGSNYTPFNTPLEYSEMEIKDFILAGYEKVKDAEVKIFVSHAPPLDTETDMVSGDHHVGSSSVRSFIEEFQPQLCITGHIHESSGKDVIGKTLILNPGMLKNGGYVDIIVKGKEIQADIRKC